MMPSGFHEPEKQIREVGVEEHSMEGFCMGSDGTCLHT